MAIDEKLAERVRASLSKQKAVYTERRMFGGICFMVDDKMCLGVDKSRLMVRLDPDVYEDALMRPGCVPMEFTGRPMRGFVFVNEDGLESARQLDSWIGLALDFNPKAKASKARRPRRSTKPLKRNTGG